MIETDWNKLAVEYTRRSFSSGDWNYGYKLLLKLLGDVSGRRILDYGCGSGKFSRVLAKRGADVIAVDANEEMLALGKEQNCRGIKYSQVVDNDLSFLESVQDAIATYIICTKERDEEVFEFMNQIYQKLSNNGCFFVLDPHPDNRKSDNGKPFEIVLEGMENPVFDYWRPIEKYISILEKSGFNVEKVVEPKDEKGKPQMLLVKSKKCIT